MKVYLVLIFSTIVYSSECTKDCLIDYFDESYLDCREYHKVSKGFEKCIKDSIESGYDYCEEYCFGFN